MFGMYTVLEIKKNRVRKDSCLNIAENMLLRLVNGWQRQPIFFERQREKFSEVKRKDLIEGTEVKVKWSRYRPVVAQRVGRGIAVLFHDRGTGRVWVVSSTPWPHFTPRERPGTHFTGGWVGPRAGLDGRKVSSPPAFDPVPSIPRYTDWATGSALLKELITFK